jgi:hypothetical protein
MIARIRNTLLLELCLSLQGNMWRCDGWVRGPSERVSDVSFGHLPTDYRVFEGARGNHTLLMLGHFIYTFYLRVNSGFWARH